MQCLFRFELREDRKREVARSIGHLEGFKRDLFDVLTAFGLPDNQEQLTAQPRHRLRPSDATSKSGQPPEETGSSTALDALGNSQTVDFESAKAGPTGHIVGSSRAKAAVPGTLEVGMSEAGILAPYQTEVRDMMLSGASMLPPTSLSRETRQAGGHSTNATLLVGRQMQQVYEEIKRLALSASTGDVVGMLGLSGHPSPDGRLEVGLTTEAYEQLRTDLRREMRTEFEELAGNMVDRLTVMLASTPTPASVRTSRPRRSSRGHDRTEEVRASAIPTIERTSSHRPRVLHHATSSNPMWSKDELAYVVTREADFQRSDPTLNPADRGTSSVGWPHSTISRSDQATENVSGEAVRTAGEAWADSNPKVAFSPPPALQATDSTHFPGNLRPAPPPPLAASRNLVGGIYLPSSAVSGAMVTRVATATAEPGNSDEHRRSRRLRPLTSKNKRYPEDPRFTATGTAVVSTGGLSDYPITTATSTSSSIMGPDNLSNHANNISSRSSALKGPLGLPPLAKTSSSRVSLSPIDRVQPWASIASRSGVISLSETAKSTSLRLNQYQGEAI